MAQILNSTPSVEGFHESWLDLGVVNGSDPSATSSCSQALLSKGPVPCPRSSKSFWLGLQPTSHPQNSLKTLIQSIYRNTGHHPLTLQSLDPIHTSLSALPCGPACVRHASFSPSRECVSHKLIVLTSTSGERCLTSPVILERGPSLSRKLCSLIFGLSSRMFAEQITLGGR